MFRKVTSKNAVDSIVHFVHVTTTRLKDEKSARDNDVLACNFAKYSRPILIFLLAASAINLS